MTERTKGSVPFSGEPYQGSITIKEQADHTYIWRVDNKTFRIANLGNVLIAEIPNPYYRLALVGALSEGSAEIVSYVPSEPNAPTYRLWQYVPADQIPFGNKSVVPYGVNYGGIDLKVRLQPRIWLEHGMVMQVIYYAEFYPKGTVIDNLEVINLREENINSYYGWIVVDDDVVLSSDNRATYINKTKELNDRTVYEVDTYAVPVVRERWYWQLDQATNFAIKRAINIEWYAKDDGPSGPVILAPMKEYIKYYPTATDQINEIERRRSNVVGNLRDTVLTFIVMTQTLPDIAIDPFNPTELELGNAKLNAIALGQAYLTEIGTQLMDFVDNGTDHAALTTMASVTRSKHSWLDNDLAVVGAPGVSIAQYVYTEMTTDISDHIDSFDWNSLPEY